MDQNARPKRPNRLWVGVVAIIAALAVAVPAFGAGSKSSSDTTTTTAPAAKKQDRPAAKADCPGKGGGANESARIE